MERKPHMGFRFRKSFKIGPARMTFSKSGVSHSIGGKGFRITRTAKGKTRTTVSIPKTGLSYTSEGGTRRKKPTKSPTKLSSSSYSVKSRDCSEAISRNSNIPKRYTNPHKPPKSPKVYLICGIIIVIAGLLMLFLLWPLGLISLALGIYYIVCGPKIYANLVEKYKAEYPEFEE